MTKCKVIALVGRWRRSGDRTGTKEKRTCAIERIQSARGVLAD